MSDRHVVGVDESGRGPVIGPLVACGVMVSEENLEVLSEAGVRNSKKLSPERRERLANTIRKAAEAYEVVELGARTIDRLSGDGVNLNRIEAVGFASILKGLDADEAYIDSAGASPEKFVDILQGFLNADIDLTVECKADKNYSVVSAASILAKVKRDKRVEELGKEYSEIGSGYPSDKRTVRFLRKQMENRAKLPDFVRKSWKTVNRLE
ncbi:hypothetical protein AKJ62_00875 [candidate division MSBL1 archaeon SCGC-AAA259D14]|uniref:Ribonuclease HII n=1 Tax=candidate division MSBL1 archaeon SCGC-AAA259D14 TaxID=1698261 RepID=A0A133U8H4_9EURY|nr:hypothetical protein AKJ62_00875 [candidate division MSBL1 archaeon SCGC-AAA259D14]